MSQNRLITKVNACEINNADKWLNKRNQSGTDIFFRLEAVDNGFPKLCLKCINVFTGLNSHNLM